MELAAGGDLQLLEHLGQVVLDGSGTDEQAGADLGVGKPLSGQPGNDGLLNHGQRARILVATRRCAVLLGLCSGRWRPALHPGTESLGWG